MPGIPDEKTLHTAADWWLRLRDHDGSDETIEQWLTWTRADRSHMEAFERVTELGERLGTIDAFTRRQWIDEFAPPVVARRSWLPLAAAAAAVIALFGGYVAWSTFNASVTTASYTSAVAQNRTINLPDGSTVAMGGASMLTTRFTRGERRVELGAGEAFFQVAHNAKQPFIVTVGNVSIRDIGTAFDIRRSGQRVTIAVTEGRVQIFDGSGTADHDTHGPHMLEAVAGERVSYDPDVSAMSISPVTPEQATAWRSDRLEFINEPLEVVIANVNRYSIHPVHIADADLEVLTFTGTIKTDAIDQWLGALPQVFPLRVSRGADQVILSNAERRPSP